MKKSFLLGLIIGLFVASAANIVVANTNNVRQYVSAYLNSDIKVELNGEPINFKNTPLNYNHTNYFSIRELAEILGLDVNWNENKRTIELNTKINLDKNNSSKGVNSMENIIIKHPDEQYFDIIIKEKNISYDPENNVGYYYMTDEEVAAYNALTELKLQYCTSVLTQFAQKYHEIYEDSLTADSFKVHFVYNDKIVLTFQDTGNFEGVNLELNLNQDN